MIITEVLYKSLLTLTVLFPTFQERIKTNYNNYQLTITKAAIEQKNWKFVEKIIEKRPELIFKPFTGNGKKYAFIPIEEFQRNPASYSGGLIYRLINECDNEQTLQHALKNYHHYISMNQLLEHTIQHKKEKAATYIIQEHLLTRGNIDEVFNFFNSKISHIDKKISTMYGAVTAEYQAQQERLENKKENIIRFHYNSLKNISPYNSQLFLTKWQYLIQISEIEDLKNQKDSHQLHDSPVSKNPVDEIDPCIQLLGKWYQLQKSIIT